MENTQPQTKPACDQCELHFDLGTFEGFNLRTQSAIPQLLSAQDVTHLVANHPELKPVIDIIQAMAT